MQHTSGLDKIVDALKILLDKYVERRGELNEVVDKVIAVFNDNTEKEEKQV